MPKYPVRCLLMLLACSSTGCHTDPGAASARRPRAATPLCSTPGVLTRGEIRHYLHPGDADALIEWVACGSGGRTKLPPDYLYARLQEQQNAPAPSDVAVAFARLADGSVDAYPPLIDALEQDFVDRPTTSALDLLGAELSDRFRSFAWHDNDYPGGKDGPNESYAGTLADALNSVTPERRANRTEVAVLQRDEATDALWDYMLAQWRPVPEEDGHQLNRHAVEAYVEMRKAAADDGVGLSILSGHRTPERAREIAARAGNSFAATSFSSHSLGLAIDVVLPRPDGAGRFQLSTRPMAGVVDMRQSPVHKWLHLHGQAFGWYPFQHEPWHWEYNPPGFRKVFFAECPGGAPPRGFNTPDPVTQQAD